MSIEDYEAELAQIDSELEDVNGVMSLLTAADGELQGDMRAEFTAVRERLLKAREKTLEQMAAIRSASRH